VARRVTAGVGGAIFPRFARHSDLSRGTTMHSRQTTLPPAADDTTPRPLLQRVSETFLAPTRLVPELRGGTRWLDVLVISTVIAILSVYLLPQEFFVEQMSDAVTRRGDPVEITSTPAEVARWGRYLGMLTALVAHPLFALALAGLLTLLFGVLARGSLTFPVSLAMASHAFLIPALGSLLLVPLQRLTGNADATFTPGALISGDSFLFHALSGFDLFTVWMLVVLAVWVGGLEPRIGRVRAAAVLLGLYLLLQVVTGFLTYGTA
jgi:hypothetical protein